MTNSDPVTAATKIDPIDHGRTSVRSIEKNTERAFWSKRSNGSALDQKRYHKQSHDGRNMANCSHCV